MKSFQVNYNGNIIKKTFLMLFSFSTSLFAAGGENEYAAFMENAFLILLIAVVFTLLVFLREANLEKGKRSLFSMLLIFYKDKLVDATPIEREKEILLDHDFDGIKELDNNLPPWWKYLFYVTIVWGVVYFFYFHVFSAGSLQEEEYANEVQSAETQKALAMQGSGLIDETNVQFSNDPGTLFAGKENYIKHCAACHGRDGEGLVGPNLTDEYWIHGGSINDIFRIIKVGVPDKGMISWKSQLTPTAMQEVSSYIITLQGTNPPNAKPAQGEKYIPPSEPVAAVNG